MDGITKNNLKELSEMETEPAISIYIPAERAGKEVDKNRIRLKNSLGRVLNVLEDTMRRREAEELLNPAFDYLNNPEMPFHQYHGLAVFVAKDFFRAYQLPVTLSENVYVGNRFHLKELLHYFAGMGRFYVLAVSLKEPRFFLGNRYNLVKAGVKGMPESIHETLKYDDPERELHSHTRRPEKQGQRQAVFHGQESEDNYLHEQSRRYFHEIAEAVDDYLDDKQEPLVLIGMEQDLGHYREANSYNNLIEEGVKKNPEGLKPGEIHEEAWKIVEPVFLASREESIAKFRDMSGSDKLSNDLKVIAPSALNSRVDTLLVKDGASAVWGEIPLEAVKAEIHSEKGPRDTDLVDAAVIETLMHGGSVHIVNPEEFPEADPAAAIFRY